jgi:exosortase
MKALPDSVAQSLPAMTPVPVRSNKLKVISISLLIVLVYAQTTVGLVKDWINEESLSYGILIAPMALYLAWMDRQITWAKPVVPTSRGLWMIGLASFLFLFGKLSAFDYFTRMSLVICVAGLVWTFWGSARLETLGRPLVLLIAMVPPPALIMDRASLPLRLLASDYATSIARYLGITVNQEGNMIHLAQISLGVGDACSGLNSLLAMLVTALLLSFMNCEGVWIRALLVALAIPLAVVFNILRIAGTAVIADYHAEAAMGFYHLFSGWVVFVAGAVVLYGLSKLLARFGHGQVSHA